MPSAEGTDLRLPENKSVPAGKGYVPPSGHLHTDMNQLIPHYKETLRLGLPIAVGQIGVIATGFADTMMVGRYSTDALAAATFVTNLFNLVSFLLMGYSYGLTPLISARVGRGEKTEAGGVLRQALATNGLYGLLILGFMTGLYFFIDRLGQPDELMPLVRPYYLVILTSMIFVVLLNVLRQFTDGTTDTATGMWALITGNALNVIGNYLLIYGIGPFPELGLLGAGIATLLSRMTTALILAGSIAYRRHYREFRRGFLLHKLRFKEMLYINRQSLPISLQMGMETGTFTFSAVMAGWLGVVQMASYNVIMTLGMLGFLVYYGFGASTSIRVATAVGAGDWQRVRLSANAGCHLLIALAVASSTLFLLAGEPLIRIFTKDPAVLAMSLSLMAPLILYQMSDAMQICFANVLRGTSHVMSMMWIAFVSYLCVNIPTAYVLAFPLGLDITGIFLAFSVGLFLAAGLLYYQFRRVLRAHLPAASPAYGSKP